MINEYDEIKALLKKTRMLMEQPEINNLGKSILDRLTKEVRDRVDNEPGITLEEMQEQINNELNNN